MGFFKKDIDSILVGENFVFSPSVTLKAEDKDLYTYPQDGWYWFDALDDAITFFANQNKESGAITPLQAELQLLAMGILDNVLELLSLNREAQIYWNRAERFYITDPILLSMASTLNISQDELNTLFEEAGKR